MSQRILLKLSGEMLRDTETATVLDPKRITTVANVIRSVHEQHPELAIIIGAGNIIRGKEIALLGTNRVRADHMGMLATIINGIAFYDALKNMGARVRIFTPFHVMQSCEFYSQDAALAALANKEIVILAGGTGNPYFTTDTAAALRAIELQCDLLVKGTKVAGLYDKDPTQHADARFLPHATYQEVLMGNLQVMDQTAFSLCRDNGMPIKIGSMQHPEDILTLITKNDVGSLIKNH